MNSSLGPSTSDHVFQLYDPQELLSMDSKVASGYIVLMGGYSMAGSSNNNNNKKEKKSGGNNEAASTRLDKGALNLAFMALIEGNVVDACFGVKTYTGADSRNGRSERGAKIANDATLDPAEKDARIAVIDRKLAILQILADNKGAMPR